MESRRVLFSGKIKKKFCLTRIFSICVNVVCGVLDHDQVRNKVSEEVEVKLAKENDIQILTHEYFVPRLLMKKENRRLTPDFRGVYWHQQVKHWIINILTFLQEYFNLKKRIVVKLLQSRWFLYNYNVLLLLWLIINSFSFQMSDNNL